MLLVQRLLPRLLQQGGLLLRLQLALPLRLRRLRGLLLLLPVHHLRLRHLGRGRRGGGEKAERCRCLVDGSVEERSAEERVCPTSS